MKTYRVFISYSHSDIDYVTKLAKVLEQNALMPIWDKSIGAGTKFHDVIQNYIAHAHIFMPVITAESTTRGWVHQEIGYAMALHVPIIPVSIGQPPGEMIAHLNAVTLTKSLKGAKELLSYETIENLVEHSYHPSLSMYCCTELAEERAELIAKWGNELISIRQYGMIRQKGGLSSFQIPNLPVTDERWGRRYDNGVQNYDFHCQRQLEERRVLEAHAKAAGCRLIVNPRLILGNYVKAARLERLSTFLEFLSDRSLVPDDRLDVAFSDSLRWDETVTLVGDWFSSEAFSRTSTSGFKQAIFTRHAPGIRRKIDAFDTEFDYLLRKNGTKAGESRAAAIERIKGCIEAVEKETET